MVVAMAHSHSPVTDSSQAPRPRTVLILGVIIGALILITGVGMLALWPDADKIPRDQNPYSGPGVSIIDATVTGTKPLDCNSGGEGPDGMPEVAGTCTQVSAKTDSGQATFVLDAAKAKAGIQPGDDIEIVRIAQKGQEPAYEFYDFKRGFPLTALAIAFAVLVVIVARWRGLLALLGIGVTVLVLMKFMLPAFLAGQSPLPVAVVGSTGIMIIVLYLAHGISIRTTAALFGTLFGLAVTAGLGVLSTGWANLTGIGSEEDQVLVALAPNLQLSGVVAAAMVVAGLGVLNDVTVTQASAVWELRNAKPQASNTEVFISAMRIGRDHIASSVYTLVFAYAGSAMTILLLVVAYQRGLGETATTEQVAQEVVRTLVGAIGLVLAVPATTAIAVGLAVPPSAPEAPNLTYEGRRKGSPA